MISARVTRWLSALLLVKMGFARAAEKALAQGFVALQGWQQVGTVIVAGRVAVQLGAVLHHGAFQVLVVQAQPFDQPVDGPQHGAGDIVGVHLVAAHHQQCRALGGCVGRGQQAVGAQQAIGGGVVRLAARAMQQLVEALAYHEVGQAGAFIQQVWGPGGDALAADQHVVVDLHVGGQWGVQLDIEQVHEGVLADGDDLTAQGVFGGVLQVQFGLQRL